jgi:hypothetical protein
MTDELLLQFETQGFLHLHGVMNGATLTRVQTAFDAAFAKYADQWPPTAKIQYFDIPNILDQDDVFVDLADLPTFFPVMLSIIGPDIQLLQTQARLLRPGPTHTPDWHSDLSGIRGIDLSHTPNFHIKAHFYPHDLTPDQGCLAFIPGSHRYADGVERPQIPQDAESSAVRKVVPQGGDLVLFNTHVLHMALDNRSTQVRKSLIYSYSHYWVKGVTSGTPKALDRVALTPQRRQLFGQAPISETPPFFQRAYEPEKSGDLRSLVSAGGHLLRRGLGTLTSKH